MEVYIKNIPKGKMVDVVRWAEIVIEKWEFNLSQKKLINSGELINSFSAHVASESDGNKALITFVFSYYFNMLDMGVGKGVPLHKRKELRESRRVYGKQTGNRRKAYPVFSKTFYSQVKRLGELLIAQYAAISQNLISETISEGVEKH